jgi:hypothetical protein
MQKGMDYPLRDFSMSRRYEKGENDDVDNIKNYQYCSKTLYNDVMQVDLLSQTIPNRSDKTFSRGIPNSGNACSMAFMSGSGPHMKYTNLLYCLGK